MSDEERPFTDTDLQEPEALLRAYQAFIGFEADAGSFAAGASTELLAVCQMLEKREDLTTAQKIGITSELAARSSKWVTIGEILVSLDDETKEGN